MLRCADGMEAKHEEGGFQPELELQRRGKVAAHDAQILEKCSAEISDGGHGYFPGCMYTCEKTLRLSWNGKTSLLQISHLKRFRYCTGDWDLTNLIEHGTAEDQAVVQVSFDRVDQRLGDAAFRLGGAVVPQTIAAEGDLF